MSTMRGQDVDETNTPTRSLTGPTRARNDARQARSSLNKPYARQSIGTPSAQTGASTAGQTDSPFKRRDSGAASVKQQHQQQGASASTATGGLLSGLRQAIFSRPLSWLQRGSPQSEKHVKTPLMTTEPQSTPSSEQRSAAQRLQTSAGLAPLSRPSFVTPNPSTPSQSPFASTSRGERLNEYSVGQDSRNLSGSGFLANTPQNARSPSPVHSTSASALIRSHGRQHLSVEPTSPRIGGSTIGTPSYRRSGLHRSGGDGSVSGISQAHSSTSFAYGYGSEVRMGGLSSSASLHGGVGGPYTPLAASSSYGRLPSRSPFAMQRRSLGVGQTGAGGSSGKVMASASDAGSNGARASPRSAYGGGIGSITTPSRPLSMFGGQTYGGSGSRAGSVNSRATQTPRRREWSSLRIAPPSGRKSEGEELMQEYLSMRNAGQSNDLNTSTLSGGDRQNFDFDLPSTHGTEYSTRPGTLKREASMSLDGDATMRDVQDEQPRKRQMVWDSELGFVSRQEQRARFPPRPVASNEAERLLNALEGMRTPLRDARKEGIARSATSPSREMQKIHVPLSVASAGKSVGDGRSHLGSDLNKAVSPYSRALQRSRLSQSVEPEQPGLRSRLRRSTHQTDVSVSQGRDEDDMSVGTNDRRESENGEQSTDRDGSDDMEDMEDDENVVEPPRRKTGHAARSKLSRETKPEHVTSAPVEPRTLRSGKTLPLTTSSPGKEEQENRRKHHLRDYQASEAKPMSKARLGFSVNGASAANKQRAEREQLFGTSSSSSSSPTPKPAVASLPSTAQATGTKAGNFSVRIDSPSSSTDSQPRSRSSLRQGAEKTSRTHARSGRVGLDDDADDDDSMDDSPSAEELNKLKLPTNLFPQGFSFSSRSQSPSNGNTGSNSMSQEASPALHPSTVAPATSFGKASEEHRGDGGSSLLSRLGGFAPQPDTKESTEKVPSANSGNVITPKPSFSFGAPQTSPSLSPSLQAGTTEHSASSASKPLFSFQPSVSSPLAGGGAPQATASSSTTASNFFTPPPKASDTSASPSSSVDDANKKRNDGPVPNFFASSLAKTTEQLSEPSKPSFSFGASAPSAAPVTNETKKPEIPPAQSAAPSFSFSPIPSTKSEDGKKDSTSKPSFSFGASTSADDNKPKPNSSMPAFSGFGQQPLASEEKKPSTPSFTGFGSSASSSSPAFSFGASSETPTASSTKEKEAKVTPSFGGLGGAGQKKRGIESESEEAETKKSFGGFGAAPASSHAPTFSFGNSNGAGPSPTASSSGFAFGTNTNQGGEKKAGGPSSVSFGSLESANKPAEKPSFSFGAPTSSSTGGTPMNGFSGGFGSGGGSATNAPSTSSTTSATPSFTFGSSQQQTAPSGQSNVPSASASTGFSFGASAPKAATAASGISSQSQPAFSFGQSNSTPFGSTAAVTTSSSGPPSNPFGSQESSRQNSPAPFTFGQPSTTSSAMGGAPSSGFGQPSSASNAGQAAPFAFGAPSGQPQQPGALGGSASSGQGMQGSGFSFSMTPTGGGSPAPSFGAAQGGMGSSQPFVFGSGGSGNANGTQSPGPGGGFSFGQPVNGGGMGSGTSNAGTPPPQQGNSLFNIGGPSSSSPAGNRPVRGMPSRRRKA